ncbi:MAG: DUF86 domain-containing protein [Nitrospirae bacterium]|nr:DUF86 domain-containing protein [Nitrospirota bacterium]
MKKEDSVYLKHILDAVNDIDEFVKDMDKKSFLSNKAIKYAVVRSIEIIGEASKHLSKKFRDQHKDIRWEDICGMRDKLIHDYIGVDYSIVWNVIERDIPSLKKKLHEVLDPQN